MVPGASTGATPKATLESERDRGQRAAAQGAAADRDRHRDVVRVGAEGGPDALGHRPRRRRRQHDEVGRLVGGVDAELEEVLARGRAPAEERAQPVLRQERVRRRLDEARTAGLRALRGGTEEGRRVRGHGAAAGVALDEDRRGEVVVGRQRGVGPEERRPAGVGARAGRGPPVLSRQARVVVRSAARVLAEAIRRIRGAPRGRHHPRRARKRERPREVQRAQGHRYHDEPGTTLRSRGTLAGTLERRWRGAPDAPSGDGRTPARDTEGMRRASQLWALFAPTRSETQSVKLTRYMASGLASLFAGPVLGRLTGA